VVRLGRTTFYERARRKLQVAGSAQVGPPEGATATVVDNFEHSRYEVLLGGETAGVLEYRRTPDGIELQQTEIETAYAGQGLASRLAAAALADVRTRAEPLRVTCPFITGYLQRHPEYADLLDADPSPAGAH
jgi:NAD+ kinase